MSKTSSIEGFIDIVTASHITGWVWNRNLAHKRIVIALFVDGENILEVTADTYREDLLKAGIGDGRYGFLIEIPRDLADGRLHSISVRAVDNGESLNKGEFDWKGEPGYEGSLAAPEGEWLSGFVSKSSPEEPLQVRVVIDEKISLTTTAHCSLDAEQPCAFSLPLPRYILDGKPHSFRLEERSKSLCLMRVNFWMPDLLQLEVDGQSVGGLLSSIVDLEAQTNKKTGIWESRAGSVGGLLNSIADMAMKSNRKAKNRKSKSGSDAASNENPRLLQDARLLKLAAEQASKANSLLDSDPEAALEALHWAVDLDPANPVYREKLAHILLDHGQAEKALYFYQQLIEGLASPSDEVVTGYADSLIELNRFTALATYLREATQHRPSISSVGKRLAMALEKVGDYAGAIQVIKGCISDSGKKLTDYPLYCQLGELSIKAGDPEQAAEYFRSASAIDPNQFQAKMGLAEVLVILGREAEAIALMRKAQEIAPEAQQEQIDDWLTQLRTAHQVRLPKLIAYYLPQFHPTPENNEWWGEGFTEWSNVTRATPLFGGHLQPRRPTALGYYDLRLPESVNAQYELARRYGIDAFCYYYYWFNGRKLLDKPLNDLMQGKTGPFPFMICWVNEEWRRNWDGMSGEILMPIEHSHEMDMKFIEDNLHVLEHPEYVRVDGKPILMVYSANKLSDPKKIAAAWKEYAVSRGLPGLYLCAVQSFGFDDPLAIGFDAAVEFPPHCLWDKYPGQNYLREINDLPGLVHGFRGKVYDYHYFADCAIQRPEEPYPLHRACMLAWDNTARRGKSASVYHHFAVGKYRQWLSSNVAKALRNPSTPLVFINAWNEWAEGSVLEPDEHFGHEMLENTRWARRQGVYDYLETWWGSGEPAFHHDRLENRERVLLFGHDAFFGGAQINLLHMARHLKRSLGMDISIILLKGGELVPEYEQVAPTVVLEHLPNWQEAVQGLIYHHACMGVRKAICNTTVTGEVVGMLKERGFMVCSLVHEMPAIIQSYGLENAALTIAKHADAVVFASSVVRDHFTQRFATDPNKLLVAPQGIAPNNYQDQRETLRIAIRKELDLPEDAAIVMGCGYGDTRKGIDLFVQIAAQVRRELPGKTVAFVWVGALEDRMQSYVDNDVRALGLTDIFRVTGKVQDTARYYIAAEIFALTSREDPFPSVVMEAMDAGLPVIAFDGGGGYVDIVGEETGALVPYLDTRAFADAIVNLLSSPDRLVELRASNHDFCRAHFSYVPYLKKLLALLRGMSTSAVAKGVLTPDASKNGQRISVIVPNYNYARYLELRLRTIFDQTLQPDEIIILDDASTDFSMDVIESLVAESPVPCRVVRNETNSGNVFHQWAKGIEAATGDLIWIAEADDYCEPTLLQNMVPHFDDPEISLAYAESWMVDESGKGHGAHYAQYYRQFHGELFEDNFVLPGKELLNRCMFINNTIPNASAVVFRRTAAQGLLDDIQDYAFSGDWWFWINIAARGKVAYHAQPLNYHRRHKGSVMGRVLKDGEQLLMEFIAFYERVASRMNDMLVPETNQEMLARLSQLYRDNADLGDDIAQHPKLGAAYAQLKSLFNSETV